MAQDTVLLEHINNIKNNNCKRGRILNGFFCYFRKAHIHLEIPHFVNDGRVKLLILLVG
jgi:hypothetical protein